MEGSYLDKFAGVDVPRRPASIPRLLAQREQGLAKNPRMLASSCAWNSSRFHNMILAVGPGTPATALLDPNVRDSSTSDSDSSNSEGVAHDDDEEEESQLEEEPEEAEEEQDETKEESEEEVQSRRRRPAQEEEDEDMPPEVSRAMWLIRRHLEQSAEESEEEASFFAPEGTDDEEEDLVITPAGKGVPSMRHGGCINTAAWLTCPWRLSLVGSSGDYASCVTSVETPTQLLTAGDDRVVKFWDVRHAMGTSNPLPGGRYTATPFADDAYSEDDAYSCHDSWKDLVQNVETPVAGSVLPLATLVTGHRNNIFHATPLDFDPGKIATCGADGALRISDVHSSTEGGALVVHLDEHRAGEGLRLSLLGRPTMCFSHHFVDAHTGLLCTERGLKHFDVRLSSREQQRSSLLGGNTKTIKSCAVWSTDVSSSSCSSHVDSAYVFVGGSSGEVTLHDLRMHGSGSNRIVQKYRPSGITPMDSLSVSGLDISKDKRELLVSYENDQIFTFPIFPEARSAAGPTLDEISEWSKVANEKLPQAELATYGGHLNRFTFLKNAKYAGPNDDYICTGSDSGHAWIYERATGAVSSFLYADRSTCNGVIPHPTLPMFITYGIDSTAKLWRATTPVDRNVDDSPVGRARRYHQNKYEKSAIVKNYGHVAMSIALECEDEEVALLPDQLPPSDESMSFSMGGITFHSRLDHVGNGFSLGNNLQNLPIVLQKNYYECALASKRGEDKPVLSGLRELNGRIASIRLRFQADQRGLLWNSSVPWKLKARQSYLGLDLTEDSAKKNGENDESNKYGNLVDLVPDFPSDWIPFDPEMCHHPAASGTRFNLEEFAEFYGERYGNGRMFGGSSTGASLDDEQHLPWLTASPTHPSTSEPKAPDNKNESPSSDTVNEGEGASHLDVDRALDRLYETALLLKKGGNAALEAGSVMEAARRYDRAIKYCAVGLLEATNANDEFYNRNLFRWTPLCKLLVMIRLNLCMVLSKFDTKGALGQAKLAHQELSPFCTKRGKVLMGGNLESVWKEDEPIETYVEAKELDAKACFRRGCVYIKKKDYDDAIDAFEESISSTRSIGKDPDALVLRRLAEAKREHSKKNKRQRKKFKRMFEEST